MLKRINSILRGWVNYFRHAVCKTTLKALDQFVWLGDQLVDGAASLEVEEHPRDASPTATAGGTSSRTGSNCSPWSRSRSPATDTGNTIPNPWTLNHA